MITAVALPAPPGAQRYERKFMLSSAEDHLPLADAVIRRHPALFRRAHPPRFVNSLYFDTFGYRSYLSAVEGLEQRVKLRIRWYGDLFGRIEAPTLEAKTKRALLGSKTALRLPPLAIEPGIYLPAPQRWLLAAGAEEQACDRLAALVPTLLVRYRRHYFVSADGALRLTLDSELGFYAARQGTNGFLHRKRDRGSAVLELKYAPEADDFAREAAQALPFRVTKSSKYVRGLELLLRGRIL